NSEPRTPSFFNQEPFLMQFPPSNTLVFQSRTVLDAISALEHPHFSIKTFKPRVYESYINCFSSKAVKGFLFFCKFVQIHAYTSDSAYKTYGRCSFETSASGKLGLLYRRLCIYPIGSHDIDYVGMFVYFRRNRCLLC